MINYNEKILPKTTISLSIDNRAFKFGDAIFETIKVENKKVFFIEDHYFRLMASTRMLRMQMAMGFTLEFFENEIIKLIEALNLVDARVRFSVYRKEGGLYQPKNNKVDFLIEASSLQILKKDSYEIELFKDHYVCSGTLSTIKSNNRLINVLASIFKNDNSYDNCILINEKKQLVEAINANIFLVKGNRISTPSLSEGCIKGITRKKLIEIIKKDSNLSIEEVEISPFELQKADEVFITNTIIGIQPITKYRRKEYRVETSIELNKKLRALSLLS